MSALASHASKLTLPFPFCLRSSPFTSHQSRVTSHCKANSFRLQSYITHRGWGVPQGGPSRNYTAQLVGASLAGIVAGLAGGHRVDSVAMKSQGRKGGHGPEEDRIVPIILAAGPRGSLPFPKALAPFGRGTALERAVRCCSEARGFGPAVVVLGSETDRILAEWKPPKGTIVVRNVDWQEGQITSLRAGLRRVPRNAAFLLYPVDYPLLFPGLLARLWWAYSHRAPGEGIVVPAMNGRDGHPILVAPELRREFARAEKARDVVHRPDRPQRLLRVRVRDTAIFRDFDSPSTYRLCVRLLSGHYRA